MALCLSGLSPDRFFFCGFLPSKQGARKAAFEEIKGIHSTLLFFESPKRVISFLKDAQDILGDRDGAVCREMTKLYEEVQKGKLSFLIDHYESHPPRGEIVIVIEGGVAFSSVTDEDLRAHLEKALTTYSVREAVDLVSKALGRSKREVYQHALSLKSKKTRLP